MQTLWKIEPHAHTAQVSLCGKLSAQETVRAVAASGYQALFITDHYTPEFFDTCTQGAAFARAIDRFYEGFRIAENEGANCGLRVFPAFEIRIAAGSEDYLVYGITPEELLCMGCLAHLSLAQLSKAIRATQNGLIFQAHPFRSYLHVQDPALLDGVEVLNANPRHDSQNPLAAAFAAQHNLLRIAGSDVHQHEDAGRAGLFCPPFETVAQFTALLKAGQTRIFGDEALKMPT